MSETRVLTLYCQRQQLGRDERGYIIWKQSITSKQVPAQQMAIIICDMWDRHWSRGANERVDAMAPRMNGVLEAARAAGIHIIHSPSNVVDYYNGSPARQHMMNLPIASPPPLLEHADPPLPIDDTDQGSDTGETEARRVWIKQHAAISINQSRDVISDSGEEIYSYIEQQGIIQLAIMGVHTNMCVLNRSFGIKQMVRWGIDVVLVRDLTDSMYNPAMPPYVSHHEGTQLVIAYIEKHWCPTITSIDLTSQPQEH